MRSDKRFAPSGGPRVSRFFEMQTHQSKWGPFQASTGPMGVADANSPNQTTQVSQVGLQSGRSGRGGWAVSVRKLCSKAFGGEAPGMIGLRKWMTLLLTRRPERPWGRIVKSQQGTSFAEVSGLTGQDQYTVRIEKSFYDLILGCSRQFPPLFLASTCVFVGHD